MIYVGRPYAAAVARSVGRATDLFSDIVAYGLVSLVALACDYGLLLGLVAGGMPYLYASLTSFSAGSAVAYMLSTRFVFAARRAASQRAEMVGFFTVGLAGLVLTQALLYVLVSRCGLPVPLAKIPTVGLVFLFNFLGRSRLVFATAPRTARPFSLGQ